MALAEAISAAIDAHEGRHALCGALRISRDGEPLFERAYGDASVQLGVPNALTTRFHIASMTKMFIAAATLRLVQDGRLSLQAHPADYVPELSPLAPGVTLHHLLSHTAGLADVYDVPGVRLEILALKARGGRLLDYLAAQPPLRPPGAGWRYSSSGFLILAYVVQAAAGAPFAQVADDLLLRPLGLADTGPDDPFVVNPGRATGQIATANGWRNAPLDDLAEIDGPREFYSTVGDIDRWATALGQGRVLDPARLALMLTPHARVGDFGGFDPATQYGYGWFLGQGFRFIGGMTPGFRSTLWQHPHERLNVVMLWNNEAVDSGALMRALRPILLP
jgi:CubicO group peptidase (beta-lactamase class C family)